MPLFVSVRRHLAPGVVAVALLVDSACGPPHPASENDGGRRVAALDARYSALRSLRDTLDVTRARGEPRTPAGEALDSASHRFLVERAAVGTGLARARQGVMSHADHRAFDQMARTLDTDLADEAGADEAPEPSSACDAPTAAGPATDTAAASRLERRLYACFGRAAAHIVVGSDTVDRLTVTERIGLAADPAERRRLFMALAPLWRTVNGDDGAGSPYRVMLRLIARGSHGVPLPQDRARMLGVDPIIAADWLTAALDAWRAATPDSLIEPWDYEYGAQEADRALSRGLPRDSLLPITRRYYLALGADVTHLGVHYDLDPRPGKTPVANTTFGARGHADAGGAWVSSESWVFATYGAGGLGNLEELIHETGHAVHLAAIHTRPEYEDWPDSDPFTEAVPDIAALEVYEPSWQLAFLGDSVTTPVAMRAKYAWTMLDIAWALFEVRLFEHPDADPNRVWTDLTSRYLHIAPHPELSWWATRGQLLDAPGYMMNYALGAVIAAALRERVRTVHGPFDTGDPTWYPWLSEHLLRFGLSRPTRDVLTEFLGGPLSIEPLNHDLARLRPVGLPSH